jgi:hypothetical protein
MDDVFALLDKAITDDPPLAITEGGIIKEGFDPQVDKLIGLSKNGQEWINTLERREQEETGIRNLKIRYNKVFGYYIEVTKSYLKLVPYRYKRKQTLVNCERFITDELKEKEDEILGPRTGESCLNTGYSAISGMFWNKTYGKCRIVPPLSPNWMYCRPLRPLPVRTTIRAHG